MEISLEQVVAGLRAQSRHFVDSLEFREPLLEAATLPNHQAAVSMVLRHRNGAGAEVLLIRRATHPKDPWSGHMALPGGRREDRDTSLLETAMRETREEVGLLLRRDGEPIGSLRPVSAMARGKRTGLIVVPFVFQLRSEGPVTTDPREVQETLWAPLGPLLSGACNTHHVYRDENRRFRLPAFDVSGRTVWGLTHGMLGQLLRAIEAGK